MDDIKNNIFEKIKHIDENNNDYWMARELIKALKYNNWQNFNKVIKDAINVCYQSKNTVADHFIEDNKMVEIGSGAKRNIQDYKLSRYACYLIAQNADSRKEVVALAQTYFAIQTRKQEILEEKLKELSEVERRIYTRNLTRKGNYELNQTALKAGVKNFSKFHNSGYKGLYNDETADDIAKRKKLRYREDILDRMGSDKLAANLFRISQTNQKIKNNNIKGEENSCLTHFNMGKDIRKFIQKQGGIMPEKLPTPKYNINEIDKIKKTC